jgi:hypothetical protein
MQGIQPELRRALGTVGSLAIPFATPVNATAAVATIAAADIAITAVGDKVRFAGNEYTKAAAADPDAGEWDDADELATQIDALDEWSAADNVGGDVVITAATRGAAYNGEIAVVEVLEATTAGGDVAAKATATIAAATIARLANGDTVAFDGAVFTKAAATDKDEGEFADAAGLVTCVGELVDWTAATNAGAVIITAAVNGAEFNDVDVIVSLFRVTATGVDGTPGFAGAVACDANNIYVCTATDLTVTNNNWKAAAIA